MKVGVFEYISGGGLHGNQINENMLCEGFSMLKDVTEDFKAAGYEVTIMLDSRLENLQNHLDIDIFEIKSSKNSFEKNLNKMLKTVDLSLIIAPETNGILSNLVRTARYNTVSLNSTPESIDAAANKARVYDILHKNNIPTPETICFSNKEKIKNISDRLKNISGPTIIKPIDGAGCEGTYLEKDQTRLRQIIDVFVKEKEENLFIIQKFIKGIPASINFIINDKEAVPISVNMQRVVMNSFPNPSHYIGGITPLNHPDRYKAINLAKKALKHFKGLRGFIGVDIVISPHGPVIIEINPRLTVSYIGSKRISRTNLAELIVRSSSGKSIPKSIETQNVSGYSKITDKTYETIKKHVEVICPKIRIDGKDTTCRFVAFNGKGESKEEKIFFENFMLNNSNGKMS